MNAILNNISTKLVLPSLGPHFRSAIRFQQGPSTKGEIKVTVCGALGQVGKSLSSLLKQSPYIDELRLFDIRDTKDLASDLNLNFAKCKVVGCDGAGKRKDAFDGTNVVVIVAASPGHSSLGYDEMFQANKDIICEIADIYEKHCNTALIALATHPINSFVPLLSELLKAKEVYDPRKIFGITTLYTEKASKYTAETLGMTTEKFEVPVIGGGTGKTVVPLLSTVNTPLEIYYDEMEEIAHVLQEEASMTGKSAPLAAYAIAKFVKSLVCALRGRSDIVECAYVRSDTVDGLKYLCTPLLLGPEGIHKNYGLPAMTLFEQEMFTNAAKILREDIKRGEIS